MVHQGSPCSGGNGYWSTYSYIPTFLMNVGYPSPGQVYGGTDYPVPNVACLSTNDRLSKRTGGVHIYRMCVGSLVAPDPDSVNGPGTVGYLNTYDIYVAQDPTSARLSIRNIYRRLRHYSILQIVVCIWISSIGYG